MDVTDISFLQKCQADLAGSETDAPPPLKRITTTHTSPAEEGKEPVHAPIKENQFPK